MVAMGKKNAKSAKLSDDETVRDDTKPETCRPSQRGGSIPPDTPP